MYKVNMMNCLGFLLIVGICVLQTALAERPCCDKRDVSTWEASWRGNPAPTSWSMQSRIPMTAEPQYNINRVARVDLEDDYEDDAEEGRGKKKIYKKFKKYMLPLLLAYKLKFFTLIPVFIGGLLLLTGTTGLAGFFFALFAATMGLKGGHHD